MTGHVETDAGDKKFECRPLPALRFGEWSSAPLFSRWSNPPSISGSSQLRTATAPEIFRINPRKTSRTFVRFGELTPTIIHFSCLSCWAGVFRR